jgi:hypothetical protein
MYRTFHPEHSGTVRVSSRLFSNSWQCDVHTDCLQCDISKTKSLKQFELQFFTNNNYAVLWNRNWLLQTIYKS